MKITAGGGGIGMRLCKSESEVRDAYDRIKIEGKRFFSNDQLYVEKYIPNSKHIEIQIIGDGEGINYAS